MKDRRWGTAVGRRAQIQRCEIFADILAVRETECNIPYVPLANVLCGKLSIICDKTSKMEGKDLYS